MQKELKNSFEEKPKLLSDALFFNKFEERNKPIYSIPNYAEIAEKEIRDMVAEDEDIAEVDIESDDDDDVKKWKIKKRIERMIDE